MATYNPAWKGQPLPASVSTAQQAAGVAAGRAAFPNAAPAQSAANASKFGIAKAVGKKKKKAPYPGATARHNAGQASAGAGPKPGVAPPKQGVGAPAMNMQQAHARLALRLAGA